jgi:hypothetical protein
MAELNAPTTTPNGQPIASDMLETACGRLRDRGIDPNQVLGRSELGDPITAAGFYVMLGAVAATEKAGQGPTHSAARLALHAGLPAEIADTLFLAYNQQSAEEAGHGDKVFGNAYYLMGGHAPTREQSVVGGGGGGEVAQGLLQPDADLQQNKKRLGGFAAILGGVELVALQRAFPTIAGLCERWQHPIAHDLLAQIRDVVRPEESRHVLIWRYVFHQLIAPKGERVVESYLQATAGGFRTVGAPEIGRDTLLRLLGTSSPTPRQLLGKDRVALQ